jgi:hypothetical protein
MPLINYVCSCGEVSKKYYKTAKDALPTVKCKCGLDAKKSFGAVSVGHKIIIDNGLVAKAVELQSPDIMEINDQRSTRDYAEED